MIVSAKNSKVVVITQSNPLFVGLAQRVMCGRFHCIPQCDLRYITQVDIESKFEMAAVAILKTQIAVTRPPFEISSPYLARG